MGRLDDAQGWLLDDNGRHEWSGKTTLLRTVTGLIRASKGTVKFNGRDVTHVSAHEKAQMGLVLVPEGRQLFTDMTVLRTW